MKQSATIHFPIIDLHCDLPSYLMEVQGADPAGTSDMGATIPYLQKGGVKLQVMALYSDVRKGSVERAWHQAQLYTTLVKDYGDYLLSVCRQEHLQQVMTGSKIGAMVSIENAAGLCEEDEPLEKAFERLEALEQKVGRIFYMSLTHHTENRFGGGNYSEAGLKDDGKALLEYISGRNIVIDLSHTSDALAEGILTHIDQRGLTIPIIASHSNFRGVWDHRRNLPDEYVQELIRRKGLIGINFLRAFLNDDRPEALLEHVAYGLERGAEDLLCFGADFFYTKNHPDKSRVPFYFPEHEDAGKYPEILRKLASHGVSQGQLRKISYENAYRYLQQLLPA